MEPTNPWLRPATAPPSPAPASGAPGAPGATGTPRASGAPASLAHPAFPPGPDLPEHERPPLPRTRKRNDRRGIGAALAALAALLAKFKAVLLLLPKLKLFTSAGSALVSVAAYTVVFGFPFAVGFVALLFVHEMGHVIALRREGIRATPPMFVPFLGAVISARSLGENALAEARVGLAGPLLGSIGAVFCVFVWHATGNDLWRALAYVGFLLNLFNLLPVVPLDGGRAMAAMAPWMWFVGFAGILAVAVIFPNPVMLLIIVFAGYETWRRWKALRAGGDHQEAYYRVKPHDRALVAAVYIALIALLAVGLHGTYLHASF